MAVKKRTIKRKTTTKSAAPKRKAAKKKAAPKRKAAPKKKVSKLKRRKPAFGGYAINFAGRTETVEQVFGETPIPPSEMTKRIWTFIKANDLSNR